MPIFFLLLVIASCSRLDKSNMQEEGGTSNYEETLSNEQKSSTELLSLQQVPSLEYTIACYGAIILGSKYPSNVYADIKWCLKRGILPFFLKGAISLDGDDNNPQGRQKEDNAVCEKMLKTARKIWDKGYRIFDEESNLCDEYKAIEDIRLFLEKCNKIDSNVEYILHSIKCLSKVELNRYSKDTYSDLYKMTTWFNNYYIKSFDADSGNKLLRSWTDSYKDYIIKKPRFVLNHCVTLIRVKFPSLLEVLLEHNSIRDCINERVSGPENKINNRSTESTLLHFAVQESCYHHAYDYLKESAELIVKMLLKAGASPDTLDSKGRSCFYGAIGNCNALLIKDLWDFVLGAEKDEHKKLLINEVFTYNQKNCAPWSSRAECFLEIIKIFGSGDINSYKDADGDTILHRVVKDNNELGVELLLNNDAKIDQKNEQGQTPLHVALSNKKRCEVAKILLDLLGASKVIDQSKVIGQQDKKGNNPLHLAIGLADCEPTQLVCQKLFNLLFDLPQDKILKIINQENNDGNTILHLVIRSLVYSEEIMQSVWKKLFEWLSDLPKDEVIRIIGQSNKKGDTLLHVAVRCQEKGVVKDLSALLKVCVQHCGRKPVFSSFLLKFRTRIRHLCQKFVLKSCLR